MEQNLNDLRKQRDRLHWISWILLLGGLFLGSMDLVFGIKLIEYIGRMTLDGNFMKYTFICTGCTFSLIGVEIASIKSTKKEKELDDKIAAIEESKNKKETMDDVKRKFESLSRDKQLQLLHFIKNDEVIKKLVLQIDSLDVVNREKMHVELNSIYECDTTESNYLEYVIEQIENRWNEIPEHIVIGVMTDIKQDRNLFKEYFSYLDWSKVSLDEVYERIFSKLEDKKKTGFSRTRTDKKGGCQ